jgi:hypothetical protein
MIVPLHHSTHQAHINLHPPHLFLKGLMGFMGAESMTLVVVIFSSTAMFPAPSTALMLFSMTFAGKSALLVILDKGY